MDTTTTIGWGIAGTGRIARTILKDFAHVPGARICAIASRSAARADAFADLVTQNLSCPRPDTHDSYVDMITNPTVDVVYVATRTLSIDRSPWLPLTPGRLFSSRNPSPQLPMRLPK